MGEEDEKSRFVNGVSNFQKESNQRKERRPRVNLLPSLGRKKNLKE